MTGLAEEEGGMLVAYLLPLPTNAPRLSFRIEEISAVRDDGTVLPLSLFIKEVQGGGPAAERRLAGRTLPPGRYTGLAVKISTASPRGAPGAAALPPAPESVSIAAPFTIERRRAVVLSLRLEERSTDGTGLRFTSTFSAAIPPKPAPGLIGVASSRGSDSVTVFDKMTGQVAGMIPTNRQPGGLALDPDRRRAYVAAAADDMVESIGLLEQDVLSKLKLRGGDAPVELALTPDGRILLSANEGSSTVSAIDALSLIETARVPVGNGPKSILVDRAGRRAYTFNTASSTITAIDIASRAAAGTMATDAGPLRGQFSRAGDKLYVIHRSSPYLTVVDPLALAVTDRVYVGPGATALKVDSQTDRIYLARRGTRTIEIYDPFSFLPVDTIPTEGDVSFLTIDGEGNNLYVVLSETSQVQVLRIVGKEITARSEVGEDPFRVALLGER